MTAPQSNATKVRITVDHGITLEVDVPRTMTATEWAGLTTRLNVLKSLARSDIMTNGMKRAFHRWTDEEKTFIKKNKSMSVTDMRKSLKLEGMKDTTIYAARKAFS